MDNGNFVISLDFELLWGVRDKKTIEEYGKNILGVHEVIPRLLVLFKKFNIHATFSAVGFLFFETKDELLSNIPPKLPNYKDKNLSPYTCHFDLVGENYVIDKYHYAPELINLIKADGSHEIGTHTFSHYYCLEDGQTIYEFKEDLKKAIEIAKTRQIQLTSLIFPRNQFNNEYLAVCNELGITCYRGNERSWLYKARKAEQESSIRRLFRFIDAYINLSGHNCYSNEQISSKLPMDIPSSRFLRPYEKKFKLADGLRYLRIKRSMSHAAKNNLTYHLWWHPHNFGVNQQENFSFLERILRHYQYLNKKYQFESISMSHLANRLMNEK
ncbi:MAG: polysaccharide deacetylase family protein [Chitinophagaceae bacterium]|nr:polysaccharide deacetylase family protein [Chitinophagaceae bacterium]